MTETTISIEERVSNAENEISKLKDIIKQLHIDVIDCTEAFEHADDSLTNLRIVVSDLAKAIPEHT